MSRPPFPLPGQEPDAPEPTSGQVPASDATPDRGPTRDAGAATRSRRERLAARVPRLLGLHRKVESGGRLDSFEIAFLNEVYEEATDPSPGWSETSPELDALIGRFTGLYREITERALNNEGEPTDVKPSVHSRG